jgi:hypothetical protein
MLPFPANTPIGPSPKDWMTLVSFGQNYAVAKLDTIPSSVPYELLLGHVVFLRLRVRL